MVLINVYSRSPISHNFTIIDENGIERNQIIYGTNSHGVVLIDKSIPKITQIEEDLFKKIKQKYSSLGHVKFFGGKTPDGILQEPLIYTAKDDDEATKKMNDFKPIITENEMATKTKNIEKAA